ncbi:hypothetical protein [Candidatus Nitrosocosmicus sp. SS]|uniref:hypothetical protein n=1 Tax=Candidatus Nitrosocosmicus agrestis TaxID=2563600 RepID=UPI00122E366A|nr:hypothetical protein [Candidatus Nitrosocosmicus sp. SS]KAA2282491.1 hypothetical protein F1Z66_06305 [Candidatus Nitrosocosmicus sp. SS]KAF0868757.1 hypothetical protein E5N71_08740 [Candidatus Nitrosocosmicus sp. SS]MDR4489654.1 hypothetical protein [Candidatus Nitrosocosmicus sp.]
MKYKHIIFHLIPILSLTLLISVTTVIFVNAQPVILLDEYGEPVPTRHNNEIIPKKVMYFNDTLSNTYNGTLIDESIEESYVSRPIPVVDTNYSLPTDEIVIPNGTVLDKSKTLLANVTSFLDCKACYKKFVLINATLLNNSDSNSASFLEGVTNTSMYQNTTIPIVLTNEGSIPIVNSSDGTPVNMTEIPNPLKENSYDISADKIEFSSLNSTYKSLVAEPSIAKKNNTLIFINNYYLARSLDNGDTWSLLDMRNDPDIDICCDNRIIYDKDHDIFVWYAQGTENETQNNNVNRLGVSKDGLYWIMYYFDQQDIWPSRTSFVFDFPHLVAGNKYLYLFTSVVQKKTDNIHQIVIRIPLDQLSKCDPRSINTVDLKECKFSYDYYLSKKKFNFTPIYNVDDSLYWATFLTNNFMRIYQWDENSTSIGDIQIYNRAIPTFSVLTKNNTVCDPQKEGFETNWCLRTDSRILTGWKHDNQLGFFWNADSKERNVYGDKFQFPYIDGVTFKIENDTLKKIGRPYIYNNGTPFLYPAVSVNSNGEIGLLAYYGEDVLKPSIIFGTSKNISTNMPWDIQVIKKSTDIPRTDVEDKDILAWGDFITLQSVGDSWYGTAVVVEGGNTSEFVQPYYIQIKK